MTYGPEMRAKISAARKIKGGTLSLIQIEEHRIRMKGNCFALGTKHSPETCELMRIARKGRQPNLGGHHTEEARKKMSETRRGGILSKEHREKIAQAHKGRKQTAEHRRNLGLVQAKIDPKECETIRDKYISGKAKLADLAGVYGCCIQTISNVIHRNRMVYR